MCATAHALAYETPLRRLTHADAFARAEAGADADADAKP